MKKLIKKYDLEEIGGSYSSYMQICQADGGDYLKRDDVIIMLKDILSLDAMVNESEDIAIVKSNLEKYLEDLTTYDNGTKIYPH